MFISNIANTLNKEVVRKLNEDGKIKRNLVDPPQKDTVAVPDSGFAILRFKADNPGYWFLHCHLAWHNHVCLGLILQVRFSVLYIYIYIYIYNYDPNLQYHTT